MHLDFDSRSFLVDGRRDFLRAGEIQYWRVPRDQWAERIARLANAGGNCVAAVVPWALHEPAEGSFDFADGLDLAAFAAEVQRQGLTLMPRIGPYAYAELVTGGIPPWLLTGRPEVLARDHAGAVIKGDVVSYLHPAFLAAGRAWYAALGRVLRPLLTGAGGPAALIQLDNELTGVHLWNGGLDWHPETCGFGRADGRYARFLARRYASPAELNAAWGTQLAALADARGCPLGTGPATREAVRQRNDAFDFYQGMIAEYVVTLAGWARAERLSAPFVHNAAGPTMVALFEPTIEAMRGERFLLGSDHYYNLWQEWKQNNPTPQWAMQVLVSLEQLRLGGVPPTVFELTGGSLADWPPVLAEDASASFWTHLAYGMKGFNWYIFAGGPNPPGSCHTGEVYDFNAGLGPAGEARPLLQAQTEFGRFLQANPWLAAAERVTDLRVGLDTRPAREMYTMPERGDRAVDPGNHWEFLHRGVLTTACCGGRSPSLLRLDRDDWTADRSSPVVVPCFPVMDRAQQQRLVRFLEAGGRLLLTPCLPDRDEHGQPCTLLRERLSCSAEPVSNGKAPTRLQVQEVKAIFNLKELFFYDGIPADAAVLGRDELSGRTVCWERRFAGGGHAIVLGLRWIHVMKEHTAMLDGLLAHLGAPRPVISCSNQSVWCSLLSDGKQALLLAMNLWSSPQEATLAVTFQGRRIELGSQRLAAMEVRRLFIA